MMSKLLPLISLLIALAAGAIILVANPAPAAAQGPPEDCTPFEAFFDWEDALSHGWGLSNFFIDTSAYPLTPDMYGTYWVLRNSIGTSHATFEWTDFDAYFGTNPLTTTYYVDYLSFYVSKAQNNSPFYGGIYFSGGGGSATTTFTATTAYQIYQVVVTTATYIPIQAVEVGTLTGGGSSIDNIYFSGCATGAPWATEPPQFCELVDNADFIDDSNWTLYNSASITNSLLSLGGVGYAEQVITNTVADTVYTLELTATGTTSDTDVLEVELVAGDLITKSFVLTDTATSYSTTLTTGSTVTTATLRLLTLNGSADVDFVCLAETGLFAGEPGECLTSVINGGEFETAADASEWTFVNGAVHNDVGRNAWLPYIISATIENNGVSAVGRTTLADTPPELAEGEYLILQFDAKTLAGDGTITARYFNDALTNTVVATYTFDASSDYQTYQTDFSLLAGDTSNIELGFFNSSYVVTGTSGLFLDNVCLFVSTAPITNPQATGGYLSINLPNCNTISGWLSDTIGIDFETLETMEEPSIWDADEWVPWLASRLWVYAIKPLICFLLILVNLFGLTFLNWIYWFVRQPDLILAWVGGWLGYFIGDFGGWLLWFTSPLVAILRFLAAVFSNWQTMFTWLGAVVTWLLDTLLAVAFWLIGYWLGQFMTILNFLLTAWNLLLPSISSVLSEIVDLAVSLWNDWVPWLEDLGAIGQFVLFLVSQIGILGDLIVFFFQTIWHFVSMVWGFLTGAADLPLGFYQAFNSSVNSDALVLLSCDGDITTDWCLALAGLVIVDETISHSFLYPMVIIGIILATIVIFWRHIWELISFRIR